MKLSLPNNNMTSGRKTTCKDANGIVSEQLFVIPNNDKNRKAIKHMNKLAKEQGSKYRFQSRWRLPKKGAKYGDFGKLSPNDARGIGLYIIGAQNNSACGYYTPSYIKKVIKENEKLKQDLTESTHPNFDGERYDWQYAKDKISELQEDNEDLRESKNRLQDNVRKLFDKSEITSNLLEEKEKEIESLKKMLKFSQETAEGRAVMIIRDQMKKWKSYPHSGEDYEEYDDGRWEDVNYEIDTIISKLEKEYFVESE
tara:strand:+ start:1400 stop:2164 length:765 start_codon:yes stop_codon:yes gene_type:complete